MTPSPEEQKSKVLHQWNGVAEGWERHFDWYRHAFAPLFTWCCEAAPLGPGQAVLDLACGSGEPALSAALRVQPGGRVVATDIAPEMLQVAERRAAALGIDNVDFRVMDAEAIGFPDSTFDATTLCTGLMFCPEPVRALTEMRRVLKPGGRCAVAVWADRSQNSFFTVMGKALGLVLKLPPPDPDGPGPFRLAREGQLEQLLHDAGFRSVRAELLPMTIEFTTVGEYLELVVATATGLRSQLSRVEPSDRRRFEQLVASEASAYLDDSVLRLTATALCASAGK